MRLLDRLDALDRRFGLAPGPRRRPPNRLMRWTAAHPWWCGLVWLGVVTIFDLMRWFSSGDPDFAAFVFNLIYLAVGYVVAIGNRNEVRRWDAKHSEPEISS